MDLSLYQRMIGVNNPNVTQAYINDTIIHVNDMFSKSPSFRQMNFNGAVTDCIINHKKSNVLDLLLRPQTSVSKGAYTTFNADTFMVTEHVANEIYPKASVELCNAILKWKGADSTVKEYRCIIKGASYKADSSLTKQEEFIGTSTNEIVILVQFNDDTKTIKPNQRFIFGESAYEVISIDGISEVYNGKGVLKLGVKYTSSTSTDDKENQIADTTGNSGWGGWQ